jgi:ParB family chromosome partitioning protein
MRVGDSSRHRSKEMADTGWLPEPLRTSDAEVPQIDGEPQAGADPLPAFLADGEEDGADDQTPSDPEDPQSPAVAAE